MFEARRHEFRKRFDHRHVGARVLVAFHEEGVEAPRHGRGGGGLAEHRELGHHGFRRRQLFLAAERHEHGGGSDRGVEAFRQALVGGDVDVGEHLVHTLTE